MINVRWMSCPDAIDAKRDTMQRQGYGGSARVNRRRYLARGSILRAAPHITMCWRPSILITIPMDAELGITTRKKGTIWLKAEVRVAARERRVVRVPRPAHPYFALQERSMNLAQLFLFGALDVERRLPEFDWRSYRPALRDWHEAMLARPSPAEL